MDSQQQPNNPKSTQRVLSFFRSATIQISATTKLKTAHAKNSLLNKAHSIDEKPQTKKFLEFLWLVPEKITNQTKASTQQISMKISQKQTTPAADFNITLGKSQHNQILEMENSLTYSQSQIHIKKDDPSDKLASFLQNAPSNIGNQTISKFDHFHKKMLQKRNTMPEQESLKNSMKLSLFVKQAPQQISRSSSEKFVNFKNTLISKKNQNMQKENSSLATSQIIEEEDIRASARLQKYIQAAPNYVEQTTIKKSQNFTARLTQLAEEKKKVDQVQILEDKEKVDSLAEEKKKVDQAQILEDQEKIDLLTSQPQTNNQEPVQIYFIKKNIKGEKKRRAQCNLWSELLKKFKVKTVNRLIHSCLNYRSAAKLEKNKTKNVKIIVQLNIRRNLKLIFPIMQQNIKENTIQNGVEITQIMRQKTPYADHSRSETSQIIQMIQDEQYQQIGDQSRISKTDKNSFKEKLNHEIQQERTLYEKERLKHQLEEELRAISMEITEIKQAKQRSDKITQCY